MPGTTLPKNLRTSLFACILSTAFGACGGADRALALKAEPFREAAFSDKQAPVRRAPPRVTDKANPKMSTHAGPAGRTPASRSRYRTARRTAPRTPVQRPSTATTATPLPRPKPPVLTPDTSTAATSPHPERPVLGPNTWTATAPQPRPKPPVSVSPARVTPAPLKVAKDVPEATLAVAGLAPPGRKANGLNPRLLTLLAAVEAHFGRPIRIVSGCRSTAHNRRINGARRSQHLHCKAADFLIPGVSKYKLAAYLKQLPGRGGVGTYCRSSFVHLDVGPKRHWHWGCGKRRKYKRQRQPVRTVAQLVK